MFPPRPDKATLAKILELCEANFAIRDELYAAAESVGDASQQRICRRLAEHLAGHAVELQQILAASGLDVSDPIDTESLSRVLFESVKARSGDSGILEVAANDEQSLGEDYDQTIDEVTDKETKATLEKQRAEVRFGEDVLRSIKDAEVNRDSSSEPQ